MGLTQLDTALEALAADPGNDALRLTAYARLSEAELHLLLAEDADGDDIAPQVETRPTGPCVLVFDGADRLADFGGGGAPYAALAGKALAGMLAGQGIGLILNPGTGEFVMSAEAVDWLAETMADAPDTHEAEITEIGPPGQLPEAVLAALDGALARAAGLAEAVWLASATEATGRTGPLLAIVAPAPGAEAALAQAVRDAVALSGAEAGFIDVAFFEREHPVVPVLKRQGLMFDLPQTPDAPEPRAPGMDGPPDLS